MRYLLCLFLACPANAQTAANCYMHDAVAGWLADAFQEKVAATSLGAGGTFVEFFQNAETGTWTVVVTNGEMISCLAASGQGWELVPEGDPA